MSIKSPYNFVPAPTEDEVFKPDWAEQVSHDIPFSDGESGELELKITAMTPIFIRNGHKKDAATNEFSHYIDEAGEKKYFIPGSSLKGMFRNVLEIMSFSRMNKKLVNNDRYSFRDLSKSDNLYMSKYKEFKINGGWLKEEKDGSWSIEECDEIAFIHHEELAEEGIPFRKLFLEKNPIEKTAMYKYQQVQERDLVAKFSTKEVTLPGGVKRTIAEYDEIGKKGTLVFTGQSGRRNEPEGVKASGKVHEFVFFTNESPNSFIVSPEMQKDFKFIYLDHDKNNISKDWEWWRNNFLKKGKKVPVFYSKDNNGNLRHFGLAYMYKLPYKNSVHQMLPLSGYENTKIDLANLIFGYTNHKKEDSLKGRVMIGNAIILNNKNPQSQEKEILGSPKASYFPYYLEQNIKGDKDNKYNTFEDNAFLRGFKRYPVHNEIKLGKYDEKQLKNDKVFSEFNPLPKDSEFKCKIRFHNLRKNEIGALLAAITFNNNKSCFHSLGAAKPFGYGKIKVELLGFDLDKNVQFYLDSFSELMKQKVSNWEKSSSLKELFSMASNNFDKNLYYPEIKDFVSMKQDQDALIKFSEIEKPKIEAIPNKIEAEAIVTLVQRQIILAKLLEGKDDNPKNLIVDYGNKPRKGDKILVKIIYNKGGNIDKLEFVRVLK
ncbi:MAG: TIGR03986 family CRISPR-associated RAMP protein [Bacteroidales bacterium]|nr:TIGR03986 family CRISPR-associated RAMP protein [Bacteroidales bacterium]